MKLNLVQKIVFFGFIALSNCMNVFAFDEGETVLLQTKDFKNAAKAFSDDKSFMYVFDQGVLSKIRIKDNVELIASKKTGLITAGLVRIIVVSNLNKLILTSPGHIFVFDENEFFAAGKAPLILSGDFFVLDPGKLYFYYEQASGNTFRYNLVNGLNIDTKMYLSGKIRFSPSGRYVSFIDYNGDKSGRFYFNLYDAKKDKLLIKNYVPLSNEEKFRAGISKTSVFSRPMKVFCICPMHTIFT